ncbi:MAG: 3-dehydroquinate synthase II family protein [Jatrophihabitans sp.]
MTNAWADLRSTPEQAFDAVRQAAVHARVAAVIERVAGHLAELPPTVLRVYGGDELADWTQWQQPPAAADFEADLILLPVSSEQQLDRLDGFGPDFVASISVVDQASLDLACRSASRRPRTVVSFADPTKIPLEIVIAAADKSAGELICAVADAEEATIVLGVLEKGSEAILYAPSTPAEVLELQAAITISQPPLKLTALTVQSIAHVGLGDRVCVDTCTHFEEDEGILVGSFAHGFMLCCSETHPLPYMPTRPFRVNAGALHSYVLRSENRTNYLSELASGMQVLAVRADGSTRTAVVGRVKLERRPLLQITAVADTGEQVCLTVQDDWHVRVLGPGGTVLNVTELAAGSQVLGFVAVDRRHVGFPVDEFCIEK